MVLHEKGLDFDTYEVDLANKSEEFMRASPTGKVPVLVDGDSIYESNVVNQYLDEVTGGPRLLPEDPKARAYARIWMASADDHFFPAVFVASVGRERGFSEERISGEFGKLKTALSNLEERLDGRDYLADEFTLADIAHAGNVVRLRELEGRGEISLKDYPNLRVWMERLEDRESYKAAIWELVARGRGRRGRGPDRSRGDGGAASGVEVEERPRRELDHHCLGSGRRLREDLAQDFRGSRAPATTLRVQHPDYGSVVYVFLGRRFDGWPQPG